MNNLCVCACICDFSHLLGVVCVRTGAVEMQIDAAVETDLSSPSFSQDNQLHPTHPDTKKEREIIIIKLHPYFNFIMERTHTLAQSNYDMHSDLYINMGH